MFKLIRRLGKYTSTALGLKFAEMGDPKVQLVQAIEDAQSKHQKLKSQAAQIIANQKQTEMRLNRKMKELEQTTRSARQAVIMADQARERAATAEMVEYTNLAEAMASRMIAFEADIESLKQLHFQTTQSAEQAKNAVSKNGFALQKKLSERQRLLSQLDQAKMQEQVNKVMSQLSESVGQDVPTLDQVRNKIEARYARALGTAEIADQSVEMKMLEMEKATMDAEAQIRLGELRSQLGLSADVYAPPGQIESGAGNEPKIDITDEAVAHNRPSPPNGDPL